MSMAKTRKQKNIIEEKDRLKLNEILNGEPYITLDEFEKMWIDNIRKKFREKQSENNNT